MKSISLLILILFLTSCQTLPVINSSIPQTNEKIITCPSPFLKEKYRLIHAIEVNMAGETRSAIIGVTVADPSTRLVSCAIMTVEGIVLFEAESGADSLKVMRALPPFDSDNFAKNMIDDIKLIFFAPMGKIQNKGKLPDGSTGCRYREENGDWIDVFANTTEDIEIKRYSPSGSLKRRIKLNKTSKNIYQNVELQANELINYSLILTLIEAQPAENELIMEESNGLEE